MGYFKKKREKYFFFSLLLGLGGFRYFFECLLPWERRSGCWPGCAYISREYSPLFLCAGGCGGRLASLSSLWGSSAVAAGLCVYLRTCVCFVVERVESPLGYRVLGRELFCAAVSQMLTCSSHLFLLDGYTLSSFLSPSLRLSGRKKYMLDLYVSFIYR